MIRETLIAMVVKPDGTEAELKVDFTRLEDGVVEFYLEDKLLFSASWGTNLARLFIRAIQLWFDVETIKTE